VCVMTSLAGQLIWRDVPGKPVAMLKHAASASGVRMNGAPQVSPAMYLRGGSIQDGVHRMCHQVSGLVKGRGKEMWMKGLSWSVGERQ
jgi:hypothetical protein